MSTSSPLKRAAQRLLEAYSHSFPSSFATAPSFFPSCAGDLGVFVFSPNERSRSIILSHYGDWPAVYSATRSELGSSEADGAYAIYAARRSWKGEGMDQKDVQ